VIAQWPSQWWSRDHAEMWDIIRATSNVIVEELSEQQRAEDGDVTLREITGEFEPVLHHFGRHRSCIDCAFPRRRTESWSSGSSTTISDSGDDTRSVHTLVEDNLDVADPSGGMVLKKLVDQLEVNLQLPETLPKTELSVEVETPAPEAEETKIVVEPPVEEESEDLLATSPIDKLLPIFTIPTRIKSATLAETASCVVTGFLVGTFIALCVMSSQRRALATHLY